jgi:arylsulfatase A-like enzyme
MIHPHSSPHPDAREDVDQMRLSKKAQPGTAQLTRRQILAGSAAAMLSCLPWTRGHASVRPANRPNVVVFLVDTLRADHLQCYGHAPVSSPTLLEFSQRATVFEQCMAAASWTKPAVASLFTGVSPRIHQMVIGEWSPDFDEALGLRVLNENLTSFDEVYKDAGYTTAWFLANPQVTRDLGFGRGFDHYWYAPEENSHRQVGEVVQWLTEGAGEPFLLFVHVLDPHDPYLCTPDEYKRLHGRSIEASLAGLPERDAAQLHDYHLLKWNERIEKTGRLAFTGISPSGVAHLRSLYDTEIRSVDDQFARILGALRKTGVYDRTAVMVTSDHGEAFNEHGKFYHGNDLFDNELHVPLVVRMPGQTEGRRVPWSVGQCDICPSLLSLIGVSPPAHMQGQPLFKEDGAIAVRGHRDVVACLDRFRVDPTEWDTALIRGSLKAILRRGQAQTSVFNRTADPGERRDVLALAADPPPLIGGLEAALRGTLRESETLAAQFDTPKYVAPVEGDRELLRALGYV